MVGQLDAGIAGVGGLACRAFVVCGGSWTGNIQSQIPTLSLAIVSCF